MEARVLHVTGARNKLDLTGLDAATLPRCHGMLAASVTQGAVPGHEPAAPVRHAAAQESVAAAAAILGANEGVWMPFTEKGRGFLGASAETTNAALSEETRGCRDS